MYLSKHLTLALAILLSSIVAKAQSIDCSKFKTGTFKLINQDKETIIKRDGNSQFEYYDKATTPTTFSVKWIDDCTYTLRPSKSTFAKYPEIPKNALLTAKIIKVSKSSYTIRATSNFSDKVAIYEIIKLK